MRDHLTHRYFDTDHSIVVHTVATELNPLETATKSLMTTIESAL